MQAGSDKIGGVSVATIRRARDLGTQKLEVGTRGPGQFVARAMVQLGRAQTPISATGMTPQAAVENCIDAIKSARKRNHR